MPTIDMTTVKQIMHGDKEIIKIEDGLGNTMWQKAGPTPAGDRIYFGGVTSGGTGYAYYSDDMQTFTSTTWADAGQTISFPSSTYAPGDIWADAFDNTADIYLSETSPTVSGYHCEFDFDNQKLIPIQNTSTNAGSLRGISVWTDGINIYNSFTHKWNKTTGTWDAITWNSKPSGSNPSGQDIFKINNDIFYLSGSGTNPVCYKIDTSTLNCTAVTVSISGILSQLAGKNVWSDGINYYFSQNSVFNIEYNALNNTLTVTQDDDWTNPPQTGLYTYKINNKIYNIDANYIWEIDTVNKTKTVVASMNKGQYAFDKHGRLGNDASCRPRSA